MRNQSDILQRSTTRVRFRHADMDFNFNWVLGVADLFGLAHGNIFAVAEEIRDGDGDSWREGFHRHAQRLIERAKRHCSTPLEAGQAMLAACYGFRAALYYCEAGSIVQVRLFEMMEKAFADASEQLRIPIRPINVPYGVAGLLGYFLEIDDRPRPTVVMIGGGDTCREDLFAFAGYPGWRRDYNVLMVDLPGQGRMPAEGLVFQADADRAIVAAVDWLYANAQAPVGPVAIYGVSGGGYFSAQGVTRDPRIRAWVASTPIVDIAAVFRTEFGRFQALPNWLMSAALRLGGMLNRSVALSLRKYAWQFGTPNFAEAARKALAEAKPVDVSAINCPCLFLVGASEAPELRRQTEMLSTILAGRAVSVTVRTFEKSEGADAHCQVNNLRLAHLVVFDWLDRTFNRQPAIARLDAWRLV